MKYHNPIDYGKGYFIATPETNPVINLPLYDGQDIGSISVTE